MRLPKRRIQRHVTVELFKIDFPLQFEGFKYDEQQSDTAVVEEEIQPTDILSTTKATTMASIVSLHFLPWLGGGKVDVTSLRSTSVDTDDSPMSRESIKNEQKLVSDGSFATSLEQTEQGGQSEGSPQTEPSTLQFIEVERVEKKNGRVGDEDESVMQGSEHRLEDMKAILKKTARMDTRKKKLKKSIKGVFKSFRFLNKKAPFYVDDEGEYDLVVTVMN